MASSNPANFANLPKDELKEIAAKGGHASHGASTTSSDTPDRNPDGTFTKGSELAKELGATVLAGQDLLDRPAWHRPKR